MTNPERIRQQERPVFSHDTNIPYAERSIKAVVWIVLAIFLVGGFAVWFFFGFGSSGKQKADNNYSAGINANIETNSNGKSAVYRFFKEMFSGMEAGLETDQFNLDHNSGVSDAMQAQLYLQRRAEVLSNVDDGYQHSLFDVIGSEVTGRNSEEIGTIHDILVNRHTGEAQALIVDGNGSKSARDLKELTFEKVFVQKPDGRTKLTIREHTLEEKQPFRYTEQKNDQLISLRRLRAGQLLDFEGNVAGQIDAIIYGNAEAQGLVLDLRPALDAIGSDSFYISFDQAQFVENPDGLDIKLTETQTRALARKIFANKTQK